MGDLGWSRFIAREEQAAADLCTETAARSGHTAEEAEECDAANQLCPICPFVKGGKKPDA